MYVHEATKLQRMWRWRLNQSKTKIKKTRRRVGSIDPFVVQGDISFCVLKNGLSRLHPSEALQSVCSGKRLLQIYDKTIIPPTPSFVTCETYQSQHQTRRRIREGEPRPSLHFAPILCHVRPNE